MASSHRKGAHAEGHENSERWLLTYADMITLLMVLFIVMYASSKTDLAKFRQVGVALQTAFNVGAMQGTAAQFLQPDGGTGDSTQSLARTATVSSQVGGGEVPDMQAEASKLQTRLQGVLGDGGLVQPTVTVALEPDGVVVRLSGSFLFDSGRAELKPNAVPLVTALADEVRGLPNQIRVEGHTDNLPLVSPLYASNWELSTARALAITHFLIDNGGVDPRRLAAVGYGEFKPLVDNDTREHRALNRRVEVRLLATPAQLAAAAQGQGPGQAQGQGPDAPPSDTGFDPFQLQRGIQSP